MNRARHKTSPLAWLRNRFTPDRRTKPNRPPLRFGRLTLEALEDRIAPAQYVDLGSLRFGAPHFNFNQAQNTYTASGIVDVGPVPAHGESFTPLADFNTDLASGSVSITAGNPMHLFTVTNGTLEATIQGAPILPLWQTTSAFTFNADALTSTGVRLTSGALPVTVGDGFFNLNNVRFADPDGHTADAQVKLQGVLTQQPFEDLSMVVGGSNFLIFDHTGMNLTGVQPAVSGSLSLGGLGFDVSNLSVSYNNCQFALTGATSFKVEGNSVTANFFGPGLVIQNGLVQNFDLALTSNLNVGDLSFTTNNLSVAYTEATQTYAVTGSAMLAVDGQSIQVTFGGGGTNGLYIANGKLQSLDMAVVSSFNLLGLQLQVGTSGSPLTVTYSSNADLYTIKGTISVPELFNASVDLGSGSQPGILIQNGHFMLDAFTLSLSGVNLGAFSLENLKVTYTPTSFTATVVVWFPEGWQLGGTVGFQDGKLNTIGFSIQSQEGIEIADTGVMITGLSGEVQNLQDPANLIVSGSMTAVWGTSQLIQVSGGFTVDRNELVMNASVSVLNGYDSGSGQLVLDWGDHDYSLQVQLSSYDGIFTFQATIDLSSGGNDLYVRATADVNVPDIVPFIGGKTLAGINFVLEWHANDLSDSFVAAWVDADFLFISVDIGIKVTFTGDLSVIGSSDIQQIESPPPAPQNQQYQYSIPFTVPSNATQATLRVHWPVAGGTQSVAVGPPGPNSTLIQQSQFSAANGISLIPQFATRQDYAVSLVGSSQDPFTALTPGQYILQLTSDVDYTTNPTLTASYGYARPQIAVGALPANPTQFQEPITLTGKVTTSLSQDARASLFFDSNRTGYHGTPIPGAQNLPVTVDDQGNWQVQANWDLDGLLPLPYYVYATINDSVNGTVYSAYSNGVTPSPLFSGVVSNPKNGDALRSFTVYLDLNNNGQFDPTDPQTTTNGNGFYAFDSKQLPLIGSSFYVGVVVPSGYQYDSNGANPNPDYIRNYDGTKKSVPFAVDEFEAIQGTVYNGSPFKPLVGWTVYLDANGNGTLDPGETTAVTDSCGDYAFHNVSLNTTYTVRLQLLPEYYQATPTNNAAETVQVGSDQFMVYENNDFDAQPISTISGNISGYLQRNGTLNPNTTPQGGWTVTLADRVAMDAGGPAAGSYLANQYASGGSSIQEPSDNTITTSYVTDPAPQAVYQTAYHGSYFRFTIPGLAPNAPYTVRLHFAEFIYDDVGDRLFRVAINGQAVLNLFDISAAAKALTGGSTKFIAVTRSFDVHADASGTILLEFAGQSEDALVNGIEITSMQTGLAINAGGPAIGSYLINQDASGGTIELPTDITINTNYVTDPAPQWVYQTAYTGSDFRFTIPGLAAGAPYAVRLHFAEIELDDPGDRIFRVAINGQTVLDHFDISAAAQQAGHSHNSKFIAITRSFVAYADATGTITIQFTGETYNALINGIEIFGGVQTTTTDSNGNYTFVGLRSAAYTVTEAVQPGYRELAPFTSDLELQYPDVGDRWHLPGGNPQPIGAVVADFKGSGEKDVAVLDSDPSSSYSVWVAFAGQFNSPVPLVRNPSGVDPEQILAGDFNGEGGEDMAVLNADGTVDLYANDRGTFYPGYDLWRLPELGNGTAYMVGGRFITGPTALAADQLAFVYPTVHGHYGLLIVYAQSPYTFASTFVQIDQWVQSTGPLVAGDLNGDGHLDLVIGQFHGGPVIAWGDGQGDFTFQPIAVPDPNQPFGTYTLALGDINGDGLLDLVVANSVDSKFYYSIQNQDGSFTTLAPADIPGTGSQNVSSMYIQDLNGDLKPDFVYVVSTMGNQALYVALNTEQANNWFTKAQLSQWSVAPGGAGTLHIVPADLDGDGFVDLVVTDQSAGNWEIVYNLSVANPTPQVVTVDGANATGTNFVNVHLGQITGRVFDDVTRDGTDRLSKPGQAGVTVYLDLNGNGQLDAGEPSMVTGPDGYFAFSDLHDGTYQVRVVPKVGRRLTSPAAGFVDVTVAAGQASADDASFGSAALLSVPVADQQVTAGNRLAVLIPITAAAASRQVVFSLEPGAPDGAAIDPHTGFFTWTPPATQIPGTYSVSVRVQDRSDPAFSDVESFAIQVRSADADTNYVTALYQTLLQRAPDLAGLDFWVGLLHTGTGRAQVSEEIWDSAEHRGLEVDQFYSTYLHRAADAIGRAFWVNELLGGLSEEAVVEGFLTSAEYQQAHAGTTAYLTGLYADVLCRAPDASGLDSWKAAAQGGLSPAQIADGFLQSQEAERQLVHHCYADYLGRAGDAAGVRAWLSQLQSGQLSPAEVAQAFLASDEFFSRAGAGLL
jgi:hypothetical protein